MPRIHESDALSARGLSARLRSAELCHADVSRRIGVEGRPAPRAAEVVPRSLVVSVEPRRLGG